MIREATVTEHNQIETAVAIERCSKPVVRMATDYARDMVNGPLYNTIWKRNKTIPIIRSEGRQLNLSTTGWRRAVRHGIISRRETRLCNENIRIRAPTAWAGVTETGSPTESISSRTWT